jgi:WD40 repeat protein/transcriptional regulator with XRE-family HTH domain
MDEERWEGCMDYLAISPYNLRSALIHLESIPSRNHYNSISVGKRHLSENILLLWPHIAFAPVDHEERKVSMRTTTYGERDYNFGAKMLTLRTEIGLTQEGLARHLGVSRRTVAEWEGGGSYPKVEHLKELIALAVGQQAFPAENAAEAVRGLWKAAHQKVLLDERWLSSLLSRQFPPHLRLVSKAVENNTASASAGGQAQGTAPAVTPPEPTAPEPRVDWGEALAVSTFYGREEELAQLTQWIVQERCRVVGVLGMGGIGKSALSVSIMYQLAVGPGGDAAGVGQDSCPFEVIIFRSLRDAPSCETLLDECLQVLSPQPLSVLPATLEQRISLMLSLLRTHRALVVLDNLENLLREGDVRGHFRPGFEGYEQLLHRVAETAHQSCLLFTSREKPAELRLLEGKCSQVHSLRLVGLDVAACKRLLVEKSVVPELTPGIGIEADQERLIELYGGNPLALKIVAETILDLFAGEIGLFLAQDTVSFGGITNLLGEQIVRLSALEQSVLCWLTIVREPVTINELQALQAVPLPRVQLLEAVDGLHRRSLIERGKRAGSFTLQSVVLEYVTALLITEGSREIKLGRLDRLIGHGLSLSHAREYVRQTQERLLVSPLLTELQSIYSPSGADRAGGASPVEEQLLSLLEELRENSDYAQGYGPANLIVLLRLLRGHLKGLDLSQLSIRGVYLQGIEMQDTTLSGTTLRDTVWTSAFDVIMSLAISPDGKWWAAGTPQGEVRVWHEGGQNLHLAWHAHTDIVWTLAFSPDGRTLATGGFDGAVKLWDLSQGVLLWMGWHKNLVGGVAFSPDGCILATGGADPVIRLWDVTSGKNLQTLPSQIPVLSAMAWSPDGSLLAGGSVDGKIELLHLQGTQPDPCVAILTGHTNWVMSLAFNPDGTQLVSGSWDCTVKLWDVGAIPCGRPHGASPRGHLSQTLTGHTKRVYAVDWSGDGRVVASAGFDNTICVFDVERSSYRAVLHGHTALVYGVAFTPDSRGLVSGSEDGTLRVWDVTSGQCVRIIEGSAVTLHDVAWSPESTRLASVGTDTLVTIWDATGEAQPRVLRGHNWHVFGVVWSPDEKLLASCGRDNVRLWDSVTGECHQIFQDPDHADTMFYGVAWSPDRRLLASGSNVRGVQVWDTVTGTRYWVGQYPTRIRRVAWSPDGTQLASCGDDGSICLWEASNGTLLGKLQGHSGIVMSVDWSRDGVRLASGGGGRDGGELFVWNRKTGELVQTLKGHPDSVFAVAWSSTGDVLVSGSSDGTIRWWDVETAECLRTCEGHEGGVWSLRVSPDGRWLASSGNDSTVRLWDLESAELLRTLRHDRPYERLSITGIRGLTGAEIASLRALGAIEEVGP